MRNRSEPIDDEREEEDDTDDDGDDDDDDGARATLSRGYICLEATKQARFAPLRERKATQQIAQDANAAAKRLN